MHIYAHAREREKEKRILQKQKKKTQQRPKKIFASSQASQNTRKQQKIKYVSFYVSNKNKNRLNA